MRILSEEAYQSRIKQAKREGYEKAQKEFYNQRESYELRNLVNEEIRELTSRIANIENLVMPTGKNTCEKCDQF